MAFKDNKICSSEFLNAAASFLGDCIGRSQPQQDLQMVQECCDRGLASCILPDSLTKIFGSSSSSSSSSSSNQSPSNPTSSSQTYPSPNNSSNRNNGTNAYPTPTKTTPVPPPQGATFTVDPQQQLPAYPYYSTTVGVATASTTIVNGASPLSPSILLPLFIILLA